MSFVVCFCGAKAINASVANLLESVDYFCGRFLVLKLEVELQRRVLDDSVCGGYLGYLFLVHHM